MSNFAHLRTGTTRAHYISKDQQYYLEFENLDHPSNIANIQTDPNKTYSQYPQFLLAIQGASKDARCIPIQHNLNLDHKKLKSCD